MAPDEAERFAAHPAGVDAVALRGWDDGGKVEGLAVADLQSYRDLLVGLAR
jgi:gamma-butyrobetaine dioxygenase